MPFTRGRRKLHLNNVVGDDPRLNIVVAHGIGDLFLGHPGLKQHPALHIARKLEASDEARPVQVGIFAAFLHRTLGVGVIPVRSEATATIKVQNLTNCLLIVPRKVQKVVQIGASDASTLNNRGIFDVCDTRSPPKVKRRHPRPCKFGHLLDNGGIIFPCYGGKDAHYRAFDGRKRE